jgi:hypothetical protein
LGAKSRENRISTLWLCPTNDTTGPRMTFLPAQGSISISTCERDRGRESTVLFDINYE